MKRNTRKPPIGTRAPLEEGSLEYKAATLLDEIRELGCHPVGVHGPVMFEGKRCTATFDDTMKTIVYNARGTAAQQIEAFEAAIDQLYESRGLARPMSRLDPESWWKIKYHRKYREACAELRERRG
jgi:hypothetical protein